MRGQPHERMGRLASRWTRVAGLQLHARVSVDPVVAGRPPVVLVHGLLVSSRYMVPTAKRLAPYYRVHAPDLLGYGRSAKPRRVLNVPELADVLAGYLQAVGLDRVHLVANSFGCQIAVDFAARYPERVERMVLAGPTVDPQQHSALLQIARWLLLNVPREPFGLWLTVCRDFLDMGPRRLLGTFHHMLADHIEEKLPLVQAPTLVVRGEHDPSAPQRWAEEATRLLPCGRLVVIPGAPHTVNYNAARRFVRLVRVFLAGDQEGRASIGEDTRGVS